MILICKEFPLTIFLLDSLFWYKDILSLFLGTKKLWVYQLFIHRDRLFSFSFDDDNGVRIQISIRSVTPGLKFNLRRSSTTPDYRQVIHVE